MHFNPPFFVIEVRDMLELLQIKVGVEFAIDASQQVQVEGRCNAQWIVVGRNQLSDRFFQIRAQQQGITGLQNRTYVSKKLVACGAVKVSDRTPQEKDQDVLAGDSLCRDLAKALQVVAL